MSKDYIKHLIDCHCILSIYKNRTKPVYHKFPVFSKLDNNEIIEGIKAKLHHYKELSTDNKEFNCLHNKIEIMYKNLENNNWILKYKEFINRKNILFPFWWEKISIME